MEKQEKNRIKWIDMARGGAMLLIIIGHCAGISETLRHIIFSFHVPMFFILSGYVYRKREKTIGKDIRQLLIPYMIAVGVIIVLQIYGSKKLDWSQIEQILKAACYGYGSDYNEIGMIGALWFLPTIFMTRRLMNLAFSFQIKEIYRAIILFVFTVMGIQMGERIWIPGNIDVALVASGFMYVGYLLNKTERIFMKDIIVGCAIIWFAAVKCGQLEISTRMYEPWLINFAGSVAGSIFAMSICERLKDVKILKDFLSFIGRHTILLLCIHDLDWRLPFELWWGFLQRFEGSSIYFVVSVLCRMGFDIGILCVLILIKSYIINLPKKRNSGSKFSLL